MDLALETKPPELVVHTKSPKHTSSAADDATVGILDGMWACLLNDYLENLDDDYEDDKETSGESDNNTVSTAELRVERRRLKRLKKREKRKMKLKALALKDLADAPELVESMDKSDLVHQHWKNEANESARFRAASKTEGNTIKETQEDEDDSKQIFVPEAKELYSEKSRKKKYRSSTRKKILDPDAAIHEVKTDRVQPVDDHVGRVSRMRRAIEQNMEEGSIPSRAKSIQPKGRLNDNGILNVGSEENPIEIPSIAGEGKPWHNRKEFLSRERIQRSHDSRRKGLDPDANDIVVHSRRSEYSPPEIGTELQTSFSGREPRDVPGRIPKRYEALTRSDILSRSELLTASRDSKHKRTSFPAKVGSHGGGHQMPGDSRQDESREIATKESKDSFRNSIFEDDAREEYQSTWPLESKKSELDEIRQKKLDRKEALLRIRAIKARIAKLED